jgi:large subunit ribosomal protein L17
MKKRIKTRQLGRDSQARKALFRGLVASLIEHGEIKTTSAKARAVRSMFEKLVTKGREGSLHARRQIQSFLQNKSLVKKLVDEIAPQFKTTHGGYTKLKIVGNRRGDNAPIVSLSLTSLKPKSTPPSPTSKSSTKTTNSAPKKKPGRPTPKPRSAKPVKTTTQVASRAGKRGDR